MNTNLTCFAGLSTYDGHATTGAPQPTPTMIVVTVSGDTASPQTPPSSFPTTMVPPPSSNYEPE